MAAPHVDVVPTSVNKSIAACAVEETQRKTFTSTWDGLRKIARNEGPTTLWRGLSPTLVMAIPANVLYFASYDWLRYSPRSPFKSRYIQDAYVPLIAGSSARIIAAIAVGPIELFRTRMQAASGRGNFAETFAGVSELVTARGYRALWAGLGLTLWRDVPFSAIYWWGYEECRHLLRQSRGETKRRSSFSTETHKTLLIDSFVAGAASGAVAAFVTTPFDVGKTRQQVVQHATPTAITAASKTAKKLPEELSMPRFLWHIFQTQGTTGLFRGWAARCLKVAPACAIMISSYEVGKKLAGGINERKGEDRFD
jgi:solute carrier family 25 protein 39/40